MNKIAYITGYMEKGAMTQAQADEATQIGTDAGKKAVGISPAAAGGAAAEGAAANPSTLKWALGQAGRGVRWVAQHPLKSMFGLGVAAPWASDTPITTGAETSVAQGTAETIAKLINKGANWKTMALRTIAPLASGVVAANYKAPKGVQDGIEAGLNILPMALATTPMGALAYAGSTTAPEVVRGIGQSSQNVAEDILRQGPPELNPIFNRPASASAPPSQQIDNFKASMPRTTNPYGYK